ncbi:SAM-dependent methyltransferase [Amycolatopsis rhabdoformis]|uniref:SAM-dependent methyltransferase n=1 Tax=Amycolatopsis rhabdoformis TaxID=1448059 RepID=A0ABZ1IKM1_9PSEU|nr:SAM-dependent methyltransferase [Amycolatopsis rhabdoformis]WSE34045.1 SAM-dependent methyltransferase [Amycolatopsis rhabdoformis]
MSELDDDFATVIDPTVPSTARVYDAGLGGKDNYEVDREMLRKVQAVAPEVTELAVVARRFLIRAVRFLARDMGIDQFLDCGSGLPTAENVHEVAQRFNPDAHVVYVDNDPVVLAHGRALLSDNENTRIVRGDIFRPATLLADPTVRRELDWNKPIALIHSMSLHFCADDPAAVLREYRDALPSGSFLVFSHALDPEDDEYSVVARNIERVYQGASSGQIHFRTRAEIDSMLAGFEPIEPGLVQPADWWPEGPRVQPLKLSDHCLLAGVARKP